MSSAQPTQQQSTGTAASRKETKHMSFASYIFNRLPPRHAIFSTSVHWFAFPLWTGDEAMNLATHVRHHFSSNSQGVPQLRGVKQR